MKECNHAQASSMKIVGVKTSQIIDLFVNQSGGQENVLFTTKNLYNSLNAQRRSMIIDTDSKSAFAYLNAKAYMDSDFFL